MGGVYRCVIPCFKATINLEFSIPLVPHVGYGIGRETRRGLESGVSGNAALKIDKRLRVVDQELFGVSALVEILPALVTWRAAYVHGNTSHQLKIAHNVPIDTRPSRKDHGHELIVQGRVKLTEIRSPILLCFFPL